MYQSLALVTGGLLYETARRQASQLIPIIESRFQPDQVTIVRNQRIPTQVINLDDTIILINSNAVGMDSSLFVLAHKII